MHRRRKITHVYAGIQDMTQLFGASADAVGAMGEAHHKQAMVIQSMVSINKEIADDIRNENTQFQSINSMVDEINNLLKREE